MRPRLAVIAALAMTSCAAPQPVPELRLKPCLPVQINLWPAPSNGDEIEFGRDEVLAHGTRKELLARIGLSPEAELRRLAFGVGFLERGSDVGPGEQIPLEFETTKSGSALLVAHMPSRTWLEHIYPPINVSSQVDFDLVNGRHGHRSGSWFSIEKNGVVEIQPSYSDRLETRVTATATGGWIRTSRIHLEDRFGFDVVVETRCDHAKPAARAP